MGSDRDIDIALARRIGDLDLDFRLLAPSGVTALFGPSGSGKTSAILMIAGLMAPDSGHIRIGGRLLYDSATGIDIPAHRRRIGCVFQEDRLFPHLSVAGNLDYGIWFSGGKNPGRRAQLIDLLDLGPLLDRRPRSLSGGEKRRVAIGRALMVAPEILLLDEPLSALDAARKAEILPYLEILRDETRIPILYVSHAIEEVTRLADHVVYLAAGKSLAAGPVDRVFADPALIDIAAQNEIGAIIRGRLLAQEDRDRLSLVETPLGELRVPQIAAALGSPIALQIKARDIVLSLDKPGAISALNILPARLVALHPLASGSCAVRLDCAGVTLIALVTSRSARQLDLRPGLSLYAIVKSVALDRRGGPME